MNQVGAADFLYQAPLLILVVIGLLLVVAESFTRGVRREFLMSLSVLGCAGSLLACVALYRTIGDGSRALFGGMLVADQLGYVMIGLFSAATALTAMIAAGHQRTHDWEVGEFYGVMLLSTAGMAMLAMAGDLVTVFLGIETMSLGVYVLTALRRRSRRGNEAAMKYFLMGAFATGILLYGIALIYGATAATDIGDVARAAAADPTNPLLIVGIFLLVSAFAFKVAAVPFHMWAPDAYQGAPTPVTGFMAAAVKAAGFAAAIRVFYEAFGGDVLPYGRMGWASIFAALAAITMTVGNLAALRQENIKRMLAYSSISHAGYALVGLVAAGVGAAGAALPGVVYYLMAYSVTTLGAFGVVAWIGSRERERLNVDDWAGLSVEHPAAALAMTLFMLSLGGMPPLAGFFGKFYVFNAAIQAHDQQLLWLVVVGVVNSVISIFYYLRVVMAMYFRKPSGAFSPSRSAATVVALVVCALAVVEMGVMPGFWLKIAGI